MAPLVPARRARMPSPPGGPPEGRPRSSRVERPRSEPRRVIREATQPAALRWASAAARDAAVNLRDPKERALVERTAEALSDAAHVIGELAELRSSFTRADVLEILGAPLLARLDEARRRGGFELLQALCDPTTLRATVTATRHAACCVRELSETNPEGSARTLELAATLDSYAQNMEGLVNEWDHIGGGSGVMRLAARELLGHRMGEVDTDALRRFRAAFGNFELTPDQRRAELAAAAGEPLTNAVVTGAAAYARLFPQVDYPGIGQRLDSLADSHASVARLLQKTRIRRDYERLEARGEAVKRALEAPDSPQFRAAVENTLKYVRAGASAEADNLSAIGLRIPPKNIPAIAAAMLEYLLELAGLGTTESARLLHRCAQDAQVDWFGGSEGWSRRVEEVLRQALEDVTADPVRLLHSIQRSERKDDLGRKLAAKLNQLVELTPEGQTALRELGLDATELVNFFAQAAAIAAALASPKLTTEQKYESVALGIEAMRTFDLKVSQTILNLAEGLMFLAPEASPLPSLLEGLGRLQDAVTPMTPDVARAQAEKSLHEKHPGQKLEDLYVIPDDGWAPAKSGSIGQVHRWKVKATGEDVAVKILRPGVIPDLDRTQRLVTFFGGLGRALIRDLFRDEEMAREYALAGVALTEFFLRYFVESFKIEANGPNEADNLRLVRRVVSDSRFITPEVVDDYTAGDVITMKWLQTESQQGFIDRSKRKRDAAAAPLPAGPLPRGEDGPREAVRRAKDACARQLGLDPDEANVFPNDKGTGYVVVFPCGHLPEAKYLVRFDGTVTPSRSNVVPDLSREGLERLQRVQARNRSRERELGLLNGDPHRGNSRYTPAGDAQVMFDYGILVDLRRRSRALRRTAFAALAPTVRTGTMGAQAYLASEDSESGALVRHATNVLGIAASLFDRKTIQRLAAVLVDVYEERSRLTDEEAAALTDRVARDLRQVIAWQTTQAKASKPAQERESSDAAASEERPGDAANSPDSREQAADLMYERFAAGARYMVAMMLAMERNGLTPSMDAGHLVKAFFANLGAHAAFITAQMELHEDGPFSLTNATPSELASELGPQTLGVTRAKMRGKAGGKLSRLDPRRHV